MQTLTAARSKINAHPKWAGDVYLIGGGPSLNGFDFEILRGRAVIAINDAMLRLPWADAVVSVDKRWMENRARELGDFLGEKFLIVPEDAPTPVESAHYVALSTERGLSEDPSVVNVRGSSGYAALNVAYLLGSIRIHLLGYDYSEPNQHWFPSYVWQSAATNRIYTSWAQEFDSAVLQLNARGVEVYDYSEHGKISAFEKSPLSDLTL